MTSLLALVFTCGALVIAAEAQPNYHTLPPLYKNIIKQAIRNAHQKSNNHVNFIAVLKHPKLNENRMKIELHLKETECQKSVLEDHRDECKFKSKRPLINCYLCGEFHGDLFNSHFIDCVPHKKVNQGLRDSNCDHKQGAFNTLSLTDNSPVQQPDCLGCF